MLEEEIKAEITKEAVYRKILWRLLPFLVLCDMFSVIDRFNIGFAKLQFMKDLGLNDAIVGMAAGAFYVGFTIFEIPSTLMMQRYGIRSTLLRIMGLWGAATILLALASSRYEFYGLRFLLGVAEAGFLPSVMLYLTYWVPNRYGGRVTSLFLLSLPVSGVISGPLAGVILRDLSGNFGLHGWQWLFLLEGVPSVLLGIVAYFVLSNRPDEARWLNAAEKRIIAHDLQRDAVVSGHTGLASFKQLLRHAETYQLACIYFWFYTILNALAIWPPTLFKSVGVHDVGEIGLRSGAMSLAAVAGMVIIGFSSDRSGERRWHIIACGLVSGLVFMALPLGAHSPNITTLLLAIGSVSIYAFFGLFWTIPRTKFAPKVAAGGIALISSFGAFGGVLSPVFVGWMKLWTGSFYGALGLLGACFCVSMVLVFFCVPSIRARAALPQPAG